jgi:hypothetical protein
LQPWACCTCSGGSTGACSRWKRGSKCRGICKSAAAASFSPGAFVNYSTLFPANENPLSEGGLWTNAASATWNHPVTTTGGHAIGVGSAGTNDAVRFLTGLVFGRDQTITATVFGVQSGGAEEIALHANGTATAGPDRIHTYEVDFFPPRAVAIVRWDGVQGVFVDLTAGGFVLPALPTDGDIVVFSRIGPKGAVVLTVTISGSFNFTNSVTDTDAVNGLDTGSPGVGMDNGVAGYGWRAWSATDGAGGGGGGGFVLPSRPPLLRPWLGTSFGGVYSSPAMASRIARRSGRKSSVQLNAERAAWPKARTAAAFLSA